MYDETYDPSDRYSEKNQARMRYYLKELEDKFEKNPNSLILRNGIAAIRQRLRLPKTVEPADPLVYIDNCMKSYETLITEDLSTANQKLKQKLPKV